MVFFVCTIFILIAFFLVYVGFKNPADEDFWFGFGFTVILLTIFFGFGLAANEKTITTQDVKIDYVLTENAVFYEFEGIKKETDYQMIMNLRSGDYDLYRIDSINSYGSVIGHKHKVFAKLKEPAAELKE